MEPDQKVWVQLLRQITSSSAVNPTMLVSITMMILGIAGLRFAPLAAALVFYVMILAPLMVFLAQVCYFTIMDPDRLQNEKHVEQKMMISRKINVIEDGKVSEILLPRHEQVIQNPGLEDRS